MSEKTKEPIGTMADTLVSLQQKQEENSQEPISIQGLYDQKSNEVRIIENNSLVRIFFQQSEIRLQFFEMKNRPHPVFSLRVNTKNENKVTIDKIRDNLDPTDSDISKITSEMNTALQMVTHHLSQ